MSNIFIIQYFSSEDDLTNN